ncbi:hypothetical protein [Paracraurococcus ruber]|uniref:hypothetical protein n=1 Tax=Paracraurococcus ruber TaxID=77675 RepID=UPI0013053871|nr:hypothetical protein [Paracraurococcus ruber]
MSLPADLTPAATCPLHRAAASLSPDAILVLPRHRSAVVQDAVNAAGRPERRLFHGDKEITFNEPALFGFAARLAATGRFAASDARAWAPAVPWERLRALLQELLAAGVLLPAAEAPEDARPDGPLPAPLPPGPCPAPRFWDDCAAITRELGGHAVDEGWLELFVPVFRVAHPALDADGRQVGEANVFPPALRLDIPTEWRPCTLPGTRFRGPRPMNVTAMRVMRAHWPEMMACLRQIRAAFLRRYPEAEGAWTVGHLERLATAVLAVPTHALVRHDRPRAGALHPALAALFRVTDGVRMVMHQMLFVPIGEPARAPTDPVSVEDILDYAERNYSYHSPHGVCAGPRAMVRDLLQVLLHGGADGGAEAGDTLRDPALVAALAECEAALDYGLLGLRAYAASFSLWPLLARGYARLAALAAAWPDRAATRLLRDRLLEHAALLEQATYLGHERWRAGRDDAYADMFRESGRGVAGLSPQPLAEWLDAAAPAEQAALAAQLTAILHRHPGLDAAQAAPFAAAIADTLLRIRAVLRCAAAAQAEINRRLGRPAPRHALRAADLDMHNRLQGAQAARLPFLPDELGRLLGLRIEIDTAACRVAEATG